MIFTVHRYVYTRDYVKKTKETNNIGIPNNESEWYQHFEWYDL